MKKPARAVLGLQVAIGFLSLVSPLEAQTRYRTEVRIPDILGYRTLKCDFHIHTVFSDGSVWPDVRSEEAWREGLDAIAITDHVEYQPHKKDLPSNHDRSFQIAKPLGDRLRIRVIRGSELTREMPPGHLNAIFLEKVEAVEKETWREAVQAASSQGAFIFWNHPGWHGQQPDRVARWYPEHSELHEGGMLHGIEVVNARTYYPEAHRWCLDKKLTMLSNSDIHNPLNLDYHVQQGDHRPLTLVFATDSTLEAIKEALFDRRTAMLSNSDIHNPLNLDYHVQQGDHRPLTLVFATDSTLEAIKEALFDRRTAVYSGDLLIAEERFLRPIFNESVSIRNPSVTVRGQGRALVQIENTSEITYRLVRVPAPLELSLPGQIKLQANATVLLEVEGRRDDLDEVRQVEIPFIVENLKIEPDKGMPVHLKIEVRFLPTGC